MSTPHNSANKEDIAKVVLLPGDPLRAKYIAENYLTEAVRWAEKKKVPYGVGNILCTDVFYRNSRINEQWREMGLLVSEMESYALYCNAAAAGVHALSILTVSDLLFFGKSMSADERERGFKDMMEVALNTAWTRA